MFKHPAQGPDRSQYLAQDTIAALATAPGGAIAILRVSGPDCEKALKLLADEPSWNALEAGQMARVMLRSPAGNLIDDALIVKFISPKSFTGEDVLEIHHHGNLLIAQRLMEELAKIGVRQALPGEFSFRAVRNGKMDISQAQAIADLITAPNEQAATLALEKMSGTQAELLVAIAEELRQLSAYGELGIDFSDQDVEDLSLDRLKKRLLIPQRRLQELISTFSRGSVLQNGVRTALIGNPNAGKSSLFNALLGEDRSIVSPIAGTTRDVVRELVNLRHDADQFTFRLEDTAGLRKSSDTVERLGIERTEKAAKEADLVLWIVDSTAPNENAVGQKPPQVKNERTLGVLTKTDLVKVDELIELKKCLRQKHGEELSWIATSSVSNVGIKDLAEAMVSFAARKVSRRPKEVLLTRFEQVQSANQTLVHLERAQNASELDLFASDLRQALHALASLIGETLPDDILGRVFSQFCIGK
jgi:tRNA modification GTPase